jgi:hypothetical protein
MHRRHGDLVFCVPRAGANERRHAIGACDEHDPIVYSHRSEPSAAACRYAARNRESGCRPELFPESFRQPVAEFEKAEFGVRPVPPMI